MAEPYAPAVVDSTPVLPPGTADTDWVSAHIFYQGDLTDLIVGGAAPLAREMTFGGLASGWFFLRYWDGGTHLRLRVLPSGGRDRDTVQELITERLGRYLRERPSAELIQQADYARYAPVLAAREGMASHAESLYPNNSVMFLPYQREHNRYGHGRSVEAVERHFVESSRLAAALLDGQRRRDQHPGGPAGSRSDLGGTHRSASGLGPRSGTPGVPSDRERAGVPTDRERVGTRLIAKRSDGSNERSVGEAERSDGSGIAKRSDGLRVAAPPEAQVPGSLGSQQGQEGRSGRDTAAFGLLLLTWLVHQPDPTRLAESAGRLYQGWSRGLDGVNEADFDERYRRRRDQLVDMARGVRDFAARVPHQDAGRGALAWWGASVLRLRDALAREVAEGRFTPPIREHPPAGPAGRSPATSGEAGDRVLPVLDICAHLLCNRLGISLVEEAYLRYLAAQSVAALAEQG